MEPGAASQSSATATNNTHTMALDGEKSTTEPSLEDQLAEAIGLDDTAGDAAPDASLETAPEVADVDATPAGADPAAVDPAAPQAAKPEAKPAEAKPGEAKPGEGDLYAPLPEHNPRKTHERFAKLVEGHKAISAEKETVARERDEYRAKLEEHEQGWKAFADMGFQGEEAVQDLVQFSQYRNALAAGNFEAAAEVLQAQARQLSLLSGKRIEVDPLGNFPDLRQGVEQGRIDDAAALELARARHLQGLQQERLQRTAQEHTYAQQQVSEIRAAAQGVDQVVMQLQRDPDYAKVEPELIKQLATIKNNYPPAMWPQEVKRAYETEARFLRLQAQRQSQPDPTPLRGNGHSGGTPAPTSMADAVLQSMGLA